MAWGKRLWKNGEKVEGPDMNNAEEGILESKTTANAALPAPVEGARPTTLQGVLESGHTIGLWK